jgi:predicted AlkP superfamily phosphohydrolase/phosphomutase
MPAEAGIQSLLPKGRHSLITRMRYCSTSLSCFVCLWMTIFTGCHWNSPHSTHKMIILGIDGMDPVILKRLIDEGKMPHFKRLQTEGDFKPLATTMPPQSPVAWSTFITGMNPGRHEIFDFIHRDPATMQLYFSTSKAEPAKNVIHLGDWILPLSSGKVTLLRRGKSFWEILQDQGIPATVIRVPANFPPAKTSAVQLSGMGTPDLQGTYGTFAFYTDEPARYEGASGGTVFPVNVEQQTVHAKLMGPRNDFRKGSPAATVDFSTFLDASHPVARIEVDGQRVQLAEKQWSDWVRVSFELAPLVARVRGICRFYLKEVRPHFKLYVSPINIDPSSPALPISTPDNYSAELQDHLGMFYTQGIPQDTKALASAVLDDGEFLQQARFVLGEELKLLQYHLERFKDGLLFLYFGTVDQLSHTFWRSFDPKHPAYEPGNPYANVIEDGYREMDGALAKLLNRVDSQTTLIVLSDHGFAPFYRAFHLNSWLRSQGYVSLLDFSEGEMLQNVDWKNTRAYATGFNLLYLNLQGREREGVVAPGAEQQRLIEELKTRLLALRDPKNGEPVVTRVDRGVDVYPGAAAERVPDLVVGYNKGYRASWETALGKFPREIFRDNAEKWSGDHLIASDWVPGVLLSNRKVMASNPSLLDIAPTVLADFGIPKPDAMKGSNVLER